MDKFIVVSMDEQGNDMAKALSNKTAMKIINKLSSKRMSASELAKKLKMPKSKFFLGFYSS